jgi:hypothetical protein
VIRPGSAVAATALCKPRYVPAESVTTITKGRVDLLLTSADFEGKAIHPVERQKSVGFVRRVYLWFKRERG